MRNLGRLLVVALLLSAVTAGGIAGCSSATPTVDTADSAGVGDASPDSAPDAGSADVEAGADGASCKLPGIYGSKACMQCVGATCCGQVTACEGDDRCRPLQKCLLDCLPNPDAGGCHTGCLDSHPDGKPLWEPVEKCWFDPPPGGCLVECT
jgi:hypothetical protein